MNTTRRDEISTPNITITTRDAIRLAELLEDGGAKRTHQGRMLIGKIRDAQIALPSDIKRGVVTMHSLVRYRDEAGKTSDVLIVYPSETVAGIENVSILSPLGIALLGLSEGRTAEYETPEGARAVATVMQVSLQPEAHIRDVGGPHVRARGYIRRRRPIAPRLRRAVDRYYS